MYRGLPPNGKLFSLIDSNIEEEILMGEVYSLKFANLLWEAPTVKNMRWFQGLKCDDLYLSISVKTFPWKYGGQRKIIEDVGFYLEKDFSFENLKFYTGNQRITMQPTDVISITFEMVLYFQRNVLFCIKRRDQKKIGQKISYKKKTIHGKK